MDRRRKISDSQIRAIFTSTKTGSVLSKRYGVSEQMIYLIRSGRVHSALTKGLKPPPRPSPSRATKTDMIEALAEAIVNKLVQRLRARPRSIVAPSIGAKKRA